MDIHEALAKASQILEEEQVQPTLGYAYVSNVWPSNLWHQQFDLQKQGWTPAMAGQSCLATERIDRPRQVYEDSKLYVFESTNFNLLLKLFSQVAETDRASFVSALLNMVRNPIAANYSKKYGVRFPSFESKTSGLALLAEFCIRTGHLERFAIAHDTRYREA